MVSLPLDSEKHFMQSVDVTEVWKGRQHKEINRKRRLFPITWYSIKRKEQGKKSRIF